MTRRPIVAGNWKMNTTIAEGLALVDAMLPRLQEFSSVERVVCPPFVSLQAIAERLRGTDIGLGAQNYQQIARVNEATMKLAETMMNTAVSGALRGTTL